jgi:hypothetical protein
LSISATSIFFSTPWPFRDLFDAIYEKVEFYVHNRPIQSILILSSRYLSEIIGVYLRILPFAK